MKSDQKVQVPQIPRNWTNDKLFLDDIVLSEIKKTVFLQMDPVISEKRAIRKDELDKAILQTVQNVVPYISPSYREILSFYIDKDKLEEYIINDIFFKLVVIMREKNKVVLEDVTAFKATNILNNMNLG